MASSQPSIDNITWPKDFNELKLMDDAFKCGICYEYLKTSMITPCGHTYCSICIRKYLTYKSVCPTCFTETYHTSLRNNRILDRLTELFSKIKKQLIKHLQIAAVHFNCNEKQLEQSMISSPKNLNFAVVQNATPIRAAGSKISLHSSKGKLNFSPIGVPSKVEISRKAEESNSFPSSSTSVLEPGNILSTIINESKMPTVPSMFLQPKPESCPKTLAIPTVPCPVCNVNIPERNINIHLDNCLENVDRPPERQVKPKNKRQPLAKMVWSLMQEKDIKKKLKEYGLSTQGDKKALTSRIQKYITLYNAECDSEEPRPISEIIRLVGKEEKIGQPTQIQQRLMLNKVDPAEVEERNKKYIQDNKESFMKLINQMKEREPVSRGLNLIDNDNAVIIKDHNADKIEYPTVSPSVCRPSTSKVIIDHIDLCDSSGPTSPILNSNYEYVAEFYEHANFEPHVLLEEGSKSNEYNEEPRSSPLRSSSSHSPPLRKSPSRSLPLRSSPLRSSPSRSPPLHSSPLRSSPSRSPPLRSSPLRSSPSRLPPLRSLPLRSSPSCSPPLHSSPVRSLNDSPEICSQSHNSESPSCIEPQTNPSDSEDSYSLLDKQKFDYRDTSDDDLAKDSEELAVEESIGNNVTNSELIDPIFVIGTEELINDNVSEEAFIPLRKSKRKLNKSSVKEKVNEAVNESIGNNITHSELIDPSFVIDTEELVNDNESEEAFVPLRKSKRKFNKSSLSVAVQNGEPRRTRRRIQK